MISRVFLPGLLEIFWPTETKISRVNFILCFLESSWNPPAEGYMSIHQQKVVAEQKELKEKLKAEKAEKRKQEIIEEQRSIHGRNLESEVYEGPVQKASPYGSWKLVENTYVLVMDR